MMLFLESMLLTKYESFANAPVKIARETKKGNLIRLKRGFYCDSLQENPFLAANFLRAPSYVSFQTALAFYDIIPEHVFAVISATTNTGKTKKWTNPLGTFLYRDVPESVFAYGITTTDSGFQIASKEKAVADTLYSLPPVRSIKQLKQLLYEDLRMDEEEILHLNLDDMRFILPRYKSTNTNLLLTYLEKTYGK